MGDEDDSSSDCEDIEDGIYLGKGEIASIEGKAAVSVFVGVDEVGRGVEGISNGDVDSSRVSAEGGKEMLRSILNMGVGKGNGEALIVGGLETSEAVPIEAGVHGVSLSSGIYWEQAKRVPVVRGEGVSIGELAAEIPICGRPMEFSPGRLPSKGSVQQGGNLFSGVKGSSYSGCTTLFVNNIPPLVAVSKLKVWFLNFGNVVDVFIPKKKCKVSGLSFAFVRFRHFNEALKACERADGSFFDGFVLEVNLSRYPRMLPKTSSDVGLGQAVSWGGSSGNLARPIVSSLCHSGVQQTGGIGISYDGYRGSVAGISYAQVLKIGAAIKADPSSNRIEGDVCDGDLESDGVAGLSPISENIDHIHAILCSSSGKDVSIVRSDYFTGVNECLLIDSIAVSGVELCRETATQIDGKVCPIVIEEPLVDVLGECGDGPDNGADSSIPSDGNSGVLSYYELEAADTTEVPKSKFVVTQDFINSSIGITTDVLDECRALGIAVSARDQWAITKAMTKKHIQAEMDFYA